MSERPAHHLLAWAASQPWAIHEPALAEMQIIAERLGEGPEAVAARLGRPLENTRTVTVRDGVAIVPVTGPIFRYANLFTQISGGTTVEALATDLRTAADDPSISAIVLEVDSPGGQMNGTAELAGQIRGIAAEKPVAAYVGHMAGSAAYWLASAAPHLVLQRTAVVGSIGVIVPYTDDTPSADAKGPKRYRFISSQSPLKRPDPTTEAGRGHIQALADRLASEFVAAVAAQRGVTDQQVLDRFGKGGLVVGSDAVSAGMADALGSLEEVIADLAARGRQPYPRWGASAASPKGNNSMNALAHQATAAGPAEGEAAWRAEFAAHPELQASFGNVGRYMMFRRLGGRGPAEGTAVASIPAKSGEGDAVAEGVTIGTAVSEFMNDPALRSRYGSLSAYVDFRRNGGQPLAL